MSSPSQPTIAEFALAIGRSDQATMMILTDRRPERYLTPEQIDRVRSMLKNPSAKRSGIHGKISYSRFDPPLISAIRSKQMLIGDFTKAVRQQFTEATKQAVYSRIKSFRSRGMVEIFRDAAQPERIVWYEFLPLDSGIEGVLEGVRLNLCTSGAIAAACGITEQWARKKLLELKAQGRVVSNSRDSRTAPTVWTAID